MSGFIDFFKNLFKDKSANSADVLEITAEDCMISRSHIPVLYLDTPKEDFKKVWQKYRQKYLLVCDDSLDDVTGVADIFSFDFNKPLTSQNFTKPLFIASSTDLKTFCHDLLRDHTLHVVVDEFGSTKGIVTIESIFNYVLNLIKETSLKKESEMNIDGTMSLMNFVNLTNVPIKLEDFDSKTVSGFIMEYLGKIPKENESFQIGNVFFQILNCSDRQIKSVKIKIL